MKIMITGAAGFIGYHLSNFLLNSGHEIFGIDNINSYYDINLKKARLKQLKSYKNFLFKKVDICDRGLLSKTFKLFNPSRVVNLAAQAGINYSFVNPYQYVNSNIVGFLNIIELCIKNNVEGLIYASSSSVYGENDTTLPFSELNVVNKPLALYGATKVANEVIAHSYSNMHGLHTTGLRYFTVYGPWYRPDMAMFIFIQNIISGKPITVYNNGEIKRDFTYIDDIVSGTISAIKKNYKYEIFNLGNNRSENLMDMIALIESEVGKKACINFKPARNGDVLHTCADINYSNKKIGYAPRTNVINGIPKLIEWYKEYYNV